MMSMNLSQRIGEAIGLNLATAGALIWSVTEQEGIMFVLKAASLVTVSILNAVLAYRHYRNRNTKP